MKTPEIEISDKKDCKVRYHSCEKVDTDRGKSKIYIIVCLPNYNAILVCYSFHTLLQKLDRRLFLLSAKLSEIQFI